MGYCMIFGSLSCRIYRQQGDHALRQRRMRTPRAHDPQRRDRLRAIRKRRQFGYLLHQEPLGVRQGGLQTAPRTSHFLSAVDDLGHQPQHIGHAAIRGQVGNAEDLRPDPGKLDLGA